MFYHRGWQVPSHPSAQGLPLDHLFKTGVSLSLEVKARELIDLARFSSESIYAHLVTRNVSFELSRCSRHSPYAPR